MEPVPLYWDKKFKCQTDNTNEDVDEGVAGRGVRLCVCFDVRHIFLYHLETMRPLALLAVVLIAAVPLLSMAEVRHAKLVSLGILLYT